MGKEFLKAPREITTAETVREFVQENFLGMHTGIPASEVDTNHSAINKNIIDKGKWSEVRPGSYVYTATALPAGDINARPIQHDEMEVIVWYIGSTVYITNLRGEVFDEVLNIHGSAPSGVGTLKPRSDYVVLTTASGMWKIILDDDYYYMYRINAAVPTVLVTDVLETASLVYGYRYIYSYCRLTGTGNRDMLSDGVEIALESGTCREPGVEKDYGEVYFADEIGEDLTTAHTIGDLTLPSNVQEATHFKLYRTFNVGENSGGVSPDLVGVGNNPSRYIWDTDVPVAKAFTVDTTVAGVATIAGANDNKFVLGDVGCTLTDLAGNTATITGYTDEDNVTIGAGFGADATLEVAIGHGDVLQCQQAGIVVTRNAGTRNFAAGDAGKTLFRADGGYTVLETYVDANTMYAAESETYAAQACTIEADANNFYRKWNDTVLDRGGGLNRISLEDRMEAELDIYIPRRFFVPLPNPDVMVIDSGFLLCAVRDGSEYWYSQYGDKEYCIGYYRDDIQYGKFTGGQLRHIFEMPSIAVIPLTNKTYTVPLNNAFDVGRSDVGEIVYKLHEPIIADENIGVIAWASIAYKGSSLVYALTNEPAVRTFDGHSWSTQNYAIDVVTGDDAVQKEYLERIDPYLGVVGTYSQLGGYKMWAYRWVAA